MEGWGGFGVGEFVDQGGCMVVGVCWGQVVVLDVVDVQYLGVFGECGEQGFEFCRFVGIGDDLVEQVVEFECFQCVDDVDCWCVCDQDLFGVD